jgi:hypothetical protein
MQFKKSGLILLAIPFAFSACAGKITKKDCEAADYYEMGYEDGESGKDRARLAKYRNSCAAEGVSVQEDKYEYGRKVGLAEYCDESRGKSDAKNAKTDGICLAEKVPPYLTGYSAEIEEVKAEKAKELEKLRASKDEISKEEGEVQGELDQINSQGVVVQ